MGASREEIAAACAEAEAKYDLSNERIKGFTQVYQVYNPCLLFMAF